MFIVLSHKRSGLGTLFNYLDDHPYVTTFKTHVLHDPDVDLQTYPQEDKTLPHVCVDMGLNVLTQRGAVERLGTIPNLKAIVLLREPTERFISQWFQEFARGVHHKSITQTYQDQLRWVGWQKQQRWLRNDQNTSLLSGYYVDQLNMLTEYHVPFHVILSNDLFETPNQTLLTLYDFMQIEPHDTIQRYHENDGQLFYSIHDTDYMVARDLLEDHYDVSLELLERYYSIQF